MVEPVHAVPLRANMRSSLAAIRSRAAHAPRRVERVRLLAQSRHWYGVRSWGRGGTSRTNALMAANDPNRIAIPCGQRMDVRPHLLYAEVVLEPTASAPLDWKRCGCLVTKRTFAVSVLR